jgi:hypothetical protein
MTEYMTAAQAYRQAIHSVEVHAGWLSKATDKTLVKLTTELDAIADYFEAHPDRWTQGEFVDYADKTVCSVGLLQSASRKAAGITDFTRPAEIGRIVGSYFIISMNDAHPPIDWNNYSGEPRQYMGPKNVVRTYRIVSSCITQLIDARQAAKYAGVPFKSDDVLALFSKRLEAAARKAEWNKLHPKTSAAKTPVKGQRKPTPTGEGWDAEHQLGTVKAKSAKKGSK